MVVGAHDGHGDGQDSSLRVPWPVPSLVKLLKETQANTLTDPSILRVLGCLAVSHVEPVRGKDDIMWSVNQTVPNQLSL